MYLLLYLLFQLIQIFAARRIDRLFSGNFIEFTGGNFRRKAIDSVSVLPDKCDFTVVDR